MRRLSPDPVSGKPEIPISWKWNLYCRNDPVNLIDPDGRTWYYVQETGELAHLDDGTGNVERNVASGYSGKGIHQDFPGSEGLKANGPIPSGAYRIGSQRYSANTGPAVMDLQILESDYSYGRDDFQIHGDNSCGDRSASEGCVILNRKTRNAIASSDDDLLVVVGSSDTLHHLQLEKLKSDAQNRLNQIGENMSLTTEQITVSTPETE